MLYTNHQTISDLGLFDSTNGEPSILSIFNNTNTPGGKKQLEILLAQPCNQRSEIEDRLASIHFFDQHNLRLQLDNSRLSNDFDFIELYLWQGGRESYSSWLLGWQKLLKDRIKPSNSFHMVRRGVALTVQVIRTTYRFIQQLLIHPDCTAYLRQFAALVQAGITKHSLVLQDYITSDNAIKSRHLEKLDFLFRGAATNDISTLLKFCYTVDALQTIADTAKRRGYCYPNIIDNKPLCIEIKGIYHPLVKEPITNDVKLGDAKRVCLLTGANMAGKSTLLKSTGIAIYLAHAGFPVPANSMRFSVLNGLLTAINLPDSIGRGYSHFYNEVMQLKEVARQVASRGHMLVIFDELFRGTNVKDAFDGSLAVVDALSGVRNSLFIISTHIAEIAPELSQQENIDFRYMKIDLQKGEPIYTYKLQMGVSSDRLGMYILQKEGVIDLINSLNKNLK